MPVQFLFKLSSLLVLPFWVLMIGLKDWSWTQKIVRSYWIFLPICLLNAVLVVPEFRTFIGPLIKPQLSALQTLFSTPNGTLMVWTHLLMADLFIGRWMYLDHQEKPFMPSWAFSFMLFFVLFSGPVGLLLYIMRRTVQRQA